MTHTPPKMLWIVPCMLAAAIVSGCAAPMAARIEAQLGATVTTANLPTALYDLDELNTLTLVLRGDADAERPGRYWYLLLVADLAADGTSVNSIRQCAYLTGADKGAVLYAADDVRLTLEIEDKLLRRRLHGTLIGRLGRVASLAEAPAAETALVKATFAARPDSLATFRVLEQHAGLIQRLKERQIQLDRR